MSCQGVSRSRYSEICEDMSVYMLCNVMQNSTATAYLWYARVCVKE
jgi:hypothetical protein